MVSTKCFNLATLITEEADFVILDLVTQGRRLFVIAKGDTFFYRSSQRR